MTLVGVVAGFGSASSAGAGKQSQKPASSTSVSQASYVSSHSVELKWRRRGDSRTTQSVPSLNRANPSILNTSVAAHSERPLRGPGRLTPVDPLNDPFGDRLVQQQSGGSFPTTPTPSQQTPPQQGTPQGQTPPVQQPNPTFPNQDDNPVRPQGTSPMGQDPQIGNGGQPPAQTASPFDCDRFKQDHLSHSITGIDLNISPPYLADQSVQGTGLSGLESRTWSDRLGNVVANGQLSRLTEGQVVIVGDSGSTVSLPLTHLSDGDRAYVAAQWNIPIECGLPNQPYVPRSWVPQTVTWKASSLCHKPLYFEEIQLERYGHTAGPVLQPLISTAHFFGNIALLPYNAGINPPNECRYALGYYRPGDCAPWLVNPVPLSLRGAVLTAGAYTGIPFILP